MRSYYWHSHYKFLRLLAVELQVVIVFQSWMSQAPIKSHLFSRLSRILASPRGLSAPAPAIAVVNTKLAPVHLYLSCTARTRTESRNVVKWCLLVPAPEQFLYQPERYQSGLDHLGCDSCECPQLNTSCFYDR